MSVTHRSSRADPSHERSIAHRNRWPRGMGSQGRLRRSPGAASWGRSGGLRAISPPIRHRLRGQGVKSAEIIDERLHAVSLEDLSMILESLLTCPKCGLAKLETMPTDACQFFYECTGCGVLIQPKPGDCCVFCSYGSMPCPPIQAGDAPTCSPR